MDVTGLGSLAMDVIMQVDSLPKADTFCIIENTTYLPGGSGTNVIVQLARLGSSCAYIGKVGNDQLGSDILESLKAENVDISGMIVQHGGTTLHTRIVVDRQGDKFIMLDMGNTFSALSKDEIDFKSIKNSKIFYTDLFPLDAALAGLKYAHEAGIRTIFNMQAQLATYESMGADKNVILNSLKYLDVFAPCRDGLYELTGTKNLNQCLSFIRPYFKGIFIVTLGAKGSVAWDSENRYFEIPAKKVTPVDTTGAGDSWIGSFIYRYFLRNDTIEEAMKFACACAAYTCTGLGARHSPTLEEAEAFIHVML